MNKLTKVIVLILILLGIGGAYLLYQVGEGSVVERVDAVQKQYNLFLTDQQKFEKALQTTNDIDTAHLEYDGSVTTTITNHNNGLSASQEALMAGYITGSTDGSVSREELRISTEERPGVELIIGVISVDDGEKIYVSGPATQGKWLEYSKSEWEESNADSDTDPSLFIFDLISSMFSKSQALLSSTNTNTLQVLPAEDGLTHYRVEIGIPSYLEAVNEDEDYSDKNIADLKIILKEATLSAEFWIDPTTYYVHRLDVKANNLSNVPTDASREARISAKFDSEASVELSRFNIPTTISAPDEADIAQPSINQLEIGSVSDLQ